MIQFRRTTPKGTQPDGTIAPRRRRRRPTVTSYRRTPGPATTRAGIRRRIVRAIAIEHRTTPRRVNKALKRRHPWALHSFTRQYANMVAGR